MNPKGFAEMNHERNEMPENRGEGRTHLSPTARIEVATARRHRLDGDKLSPPRFQAGGAVVDVNNRAEREFGAPGLFYRFPILF